MRPRQGPPSRCGTLVPYPYRLALGPPLGGPGRQCHRTFVRRPWTLPNLTVLYQSQAQRRAEGRRHKTVVAWAGQLTCVQRRWFPQRRFILVVDSGDSAHELARLGRRYRPRLTVVGRFDADAALYELPPPYRGKGRPRGKGAKLPSPDEVVATQAPRETRIGG